MDFIKNLYFLFSVLVLLSSCTTTSVQDVGIQEGHKAQVPARIAVFPCQKWPDGANYTGKPLFNSDALSIERLCTNFDDYIVRSFGNQPYLNGFTPKAIRKLLVKSGKEELSNLLPSLWRVPSPVQQDVDNFIEVYTQIIAPSEPWLKYLVDFSKATQDSDSVLLPFVTYAQQKTVDDRGMLVAQRTVGIALLLIEAPTGKLIWVEQREGIIHSQKFLSEMHPEEELPFPPWENLYKKIFHEELWRDFPGRLPSFL